MTAMVEDLTPVEEHALAQAAEDARLVRCACGCGEPTNLRQLRAAALRDAGCKVQEIADILETSQGQASELLRQARVGAFPSYRRGHANRSHDAARADAPPRSRSTAHDHAWATAGFQEIGGKEFRIDICTQRGCRARRACRPSGPGSLPAPPPAPLLTPSGRGDRILRLLASLGSGESWLATSEVAARLRMNAATASDQLAWLTATGWLEQRRSGRGNAFRLSASARKLVT